MVKLISKTRKNSPFLKKKSLVRLTPGLRLQVDSSMLSGVNSPTGNGKVNLLEMRQLSASQLHLLLHPTDDEDDAELKESTNLVYMRTMSFAVFVYTQVVNDVIYVFPCYQRFSA